MSRKYYVKSSKIEQIKEALGLSSAEENGMDESTCSVE